MSDVGPFFTCSMARNVAALSGAVLLVSAASAPSQSSADRLPSRAEEYVAAHVKLTPQERKTLGEGNPVTKLLDTDESQEVAVFGAIWIDAPIRRYVDAVTDIENFERGGSFTVTKRISSPPRLEDFAQLRLSADDVQDLRSCRVGDCEVKLGEEALTRFQKNVDWKSAKARDEANAIAQQLALGLLPVQERPEPWHGLITVNRSRSDGLTGTAGFLIRTVVRGKVEEGMMEALRKTKQVMEAAR